MSTLLGRRSIEENRDEVDAEEGGGREVDEPQITSSQPAIMPINIINYFSTF